MATLVERPLPHDLDAERAVLGACALNPDAFALAAAVLNAQDFYRDAHRLIFATMHGLHRRGSVIDLVTLRHGLGDRIEEAGGAVYIARLVDGVPRSSNVEHYAAVVAEHARRRALILTLRKSETLAYEGQLPTAALVETTRATLAAVAATEPDTQLPALDTLRTRLAKPAQPIRWLFEGLQARGSRILLAAQYKSGKTTLVANLVRAWADRDEPFLGAFPVCATTGTFVLLDFEMSEHTLLQWYREQGIRHDDRVIILPLRGRGTQFNILDARVRAAWAAHLRQARAGYVVLDCIRPVMDAIGLDEHREGGRFLAAFDALLAEAEVDAACVVAHMGHTGERARGDSRFRDWPDVGVELVRKTDEPSSPRFFRAYGRDVDVPEGQLAFDAASRRLTLIGGSRREAKAAGTLADIVDYLLSQGTPQSGRSVENAMRDGHPREQIREALRLGARTGELLAISGQRNATLYRVSPARSLGSSVRGSAPSVRQRTASECAVPFRDGALAHSQESFSSAPEVDVERI